ncbi:uncharacterized protein [Pocillopora verrucosa]|uniref:uncharacterized protein isoform X2 n=1 Tax=Pocillopora verrucosa TaxID=203993 RepID=UPI003340EF21
MQQIPSDQPQAVSEAQSPMGQQGYIPTGQQGNVPTGQQGYFPTGQQGYVPTGQQGNVPTGQQGYVPTGQQGYAPTGQPVQSVPGPGVHVQPSVNQPMAGRMDRTYLKTILGGLRIFEFILLLIASACGVAYSNRTFGMDGRATFFAGVSTFCWVMVIVLQMGFLLGIQKDQRYFKTPSYSTLIVLAVQVLMTILLIASTTRLAMVAVEWYKADKAHRDKYIVGKPYDKNNVLLGFALAAGALTCLAFLEDIPQLTKMYRTQRAKEIAAANTQ